MLGEAKFKEFAAEYDKFKAINVYKQMFEDQFENSFKVQKILAKLKRDWNA